MCAIPREARSSENGADVLGERGGGLSGSKMADNSAILSPHPPVYAGNVAAKSRPARSRRKAAAGPQRSKNGGRFRHLLST